MIDPSSQRAVGQTADIRKKNLLQLSLLPYLILAILLFTVSLLFGLSTSPELNGSTLEELVQTLKPIVDSLGSLGPVALILFIFLNNAIKALISMVLGIIVGLPTLFFVGTNGFIIGVTIAALHSHVGYGIIAASLVPHGIIEIPILLLTSALGLKIGAESVRFLTGQVSSVKSHLVRSLQIYVKWVLACLFVAAIIEVLITPLIISLAGGK
jgi:stage II sporulation protein M